MYVCTGYNLAYIELVNLLSIELFFLEIRRRKGISYTMSCSEPGIYCISMMYKGELRISMYNVSLCFHGYQVFCVSTVTEMRVIGMMYPIMICLTVANDKKRGGALLIMTGAVLGSY